MFAFSGLSNAGPVIKLSTFFVKYIFNVYTYRIIKKSNLKMGVNAILFVLKCAL